MKIIKGVVAPCCLAGGTGAFHKIYYIITNVGNVEKHLGHHPPI